MKNYLIILSALVTLLPFLFIIQHFTEKIWLHEYEYFVLVVIFIVGLLLHTREKKNNQPGS
jgi:hypothetical protein